MSHPPNFDRLARFYRWMEIFSFGPWLWWCRCAFLGNLSTCRRALVLGDGDGRFTARLLAVNPTLQIDAVDASSAMLKALSSRAAPHAARLRTQLADARCWQPSTTAGLPYDLVVTHIFLDCLTTQEVQSLAVAIRAVVSPSALWVVSEFVTPANWYGRLVARPVVWGLYLAFGWLTGLGVRSLPNHSSALRRAGFCLQQRRAWLGGLLASELWSASPPDSALNSTPALS
jgi:hypothetical protein